MTETKKKKTTAQTASANRRADSKTQEGYCKLNIRTGIRAGSGDDYGFTSCSIK